MCDSFCGDKFYANWNGSRACNQHKFNCSQSAVQIVGEGLAVNSGVKSVNGRVQLNAGIASGDTAAGNAGTDGLKKFSVFGRAPVVSTIMERLCKLYDASIACSSNTQNGIKLVYYTRIIASYEIPKWACLSKSAQKPDLIHELVRKKEAGEDEWMYQLEEAEKNDPFVKLNAAMVSFLEGNYDASDEVLNAAELTPRRDKMRDRMRLDILAAREGKAAAPYRCTAW